MKKQIIIAGFGGQGVQSLGMFIAYSAIKINLEVTFLPSYGPEMRGGTSNCSVVVSDKPVASPIIASPDIVIAMNKPSLFKFEGKVAKGGSIIVNGSDDKVARTDISAQYLDANALALKAGNIKTANIVALGAFTKLSNLFDAETVKSVIREKFAKKPALVDINLLAFDLGYGA